MAIPTPTTIMVHVSNLVLQLRGETMFHLPHLLDTEMNIFPILWIGTLVLEVVWEDNRDGLVCFESLCTAELNHVLELVTIDIFLVFFVKGRIGGLANVYFGSSQLLDGELVSASFVFGLHDLGSRIEWFFFGEEFLIWDEGFELNGA